MSPSLPLPAEILPHRDGLALLQRVTTCDEEGLEAIAMVTTESPLCVAGRASGLLAVEMAAQAAAYHACLPGWRSGKAAADRGFLVRLRNVVSSVPWVTAGSPVAVRVRRRGGMAALALYDFEVGDAPAPLVSGSLSIHGG